MNFHFELFVEKCEERKNTIANIQFFKRQESIKKLWNNFYDNISIYNAYHFIFNPVKPKTATDFIKL